MRGIKIDRWVCETCGYIHEDVNALETLRGPMLQGFSDPVALAAILAKQQRERLALVISKHRHNCKGPPT